MKPPLGESLAIIPARGGSKRIPRKNVKLFAGHPIMFYSIRAALESGCFSEVMVSTDDQEIADMALGMGANVPFLRESATSDDFAGVDDVAIQVLRCYQSLGMEFRTFFLILPTAPFVTAARLQEGQRLLLENELDAVLPVTRFSYPIERALHIDASGRLLMREPEHYDSRSQDLPPAYHDSGQFYWMRTAYVLEHRCFFAPRSGAIVLSPMEVQDIDNEDDWRVAEYKYAYLRERASFPL